MLTGKRKRKVKKERREMFEKVKRIWKKVQGKKLEADS